jgi:hypothetical protein
MLQLQHPLTMNDVQAKPLSARVDTGLAFAVIALSCAVLLWQEALPALRWLLYLTFAAWGVHGILSLQRTGALYSNPLKLTPAMRRGHASPLGLLAAAVGCYVIIGHTL